MKTKQLCKFITLFEFVPLAGEILSGKTIPEAAGSQISEALKSLREIRDDPDNTFMAKLFREINHNLFHLSDNKMEYYVEDILREFRDIAPFLCYPFGVPWSETFTGSAGTTQNDFPEECITTLKLLSGLREDTDIDDNSLSDAAKYLFSCYAIMLLFSRTLDARCLLFKLDLYEIQNRLGIYIFFNRNSIDLANAGYLDIALEEVTKDETPPKALPEHASREKPKIKPFTEWLICKKPEKLAAICKYVFDAKHRPLDYAIMLCILHQYGYIQLHEKHRIDFYDSWYAFVGKPFPKNHNYYAINKHIDTYEGFHFINDDKSNYKNIKDLFDWKLEMSTSL